MSSGSFFTDDEVRQLYRAGWVVWRDPNDRDVAVYRLGDEVLLFEAEEGFLSRVPREDGSDAHPGWESQSAQDAWDPVALPGTLDVLGDRLASPMRGAINADQAGGGEIIHHFVDRHSSAWQDPDVTVADDRIESLIDFVQRFRQGYVGRRKRELGMNPKLVGYRGRPVESGPYYHGTTTALNIGDVILPPTETGMQTEPRQQRRGKVFLSNSVETARHYAARAVARWGGEPVVYEVEPEGLLKQMSSAQTRYGPIFHAPRARVLRVVTEDLMANPKLAGNPVPPPPAGFSQQAQWIERTFPVGTSMRVEHLKELFQADTLDGTVQMLEEARRKFRDPKGYAALVTLPHGTIATVIDAYYAGNPPSVPFPGSWGDLRTLYAQVDPPPAGTNPDLEDEFQQWERRMGPGEPMVLQLWVTGDFVRAPSPGPGRSRQAAVWWPTTDTWGAAPKPLGRHQLPRSQRSWLKPNLSRQWWNAGYLGHWSDSPELVALSTPERTRLPWGTVGGPRGIYTYPLRDGVPMPFATDREHVHVLRLRPGSRTVRASAADASGHFAYTEEELAADIEQLRVLVGRDRIDDVTRKWERMLDQGRFRGTPFEGVPAAALYYVIGHLDWDMDPEDRPSWTDPRSVHDRDRAGVLWRKLGYCAFEDEVGTIWAGEPVQTVLFADDCYETVAVEPGAMFTESAP